MTHMHSYSFAHYTFCLISDVLVAVVVMLCLSSLLSIKTAIFLGVKSANGLINSLEILSF